MKFAALLLAILLAASTGAGAQTAPVAGRYLYYGNPLSPALAIAEFEVWSGGQNVVAGHPERFTQDYLYRPYRGEIRELVDGKKNPEERHVELGAAGTSTYSDTALGYTSFEVDLGQTLPIDKVVIYRSRYTQKAYQDLGWRYLLVLDEQRRIVAWQTFNVYQKPHPQNQGIWTVEPQPAAGAPAGRTVPPHSRSWLSEAEFLRDYLGKSVTDLSQPHTPEAQERLAQFRRRNDPAEIAKLGEAFFRVVELDRPALAPVKALVAQRRYAEALEAFKAPFFATIGQLAGQASFEYSFGYDPDSRDTMRVRDLANHVYGNKDTLAITRFEPGLMPPGRFVYPFQMRPLLLAYSGTGDRKLLGLWEEMTDDWALGFQAAADLDPTLREHFVLIGNEVTRNLQDLAQTAAARPDFVKELSGATLARFLMPVVEETPVAMWRVWRKCVFNHTFNATGRACEVAGLLADFRAGTRLDWEFRQQILRLHTLSQFRDGPMVELGDEGHFIFNYLAPNLLYGNLAESRPAWFTPGREAYLLDNLRQAELFAIRHASPDGVGIRWAWKREMKAPALEGRVDTMPDRLDRGEKVPRDELIAYLQRRAITEEPEARAVLDTVYGWGRLLSKAADGERRDQNVRDLSSRFYPQPRFLSDWLPYSGCYYFRGGWGQDDALLHMLKPAIANSNGAAGHDAFIRAWEQFNTTSYRLRDYATPLLTVFATEIDKQAPCEQFGRFPSGSKQDAFTQAVEQPQPMRWFTDSRLDFGEAAYRGVYHNIYCYRDGKAKRGEEISFQDDPVTLTDITTSRQIFQVRPARLFLQVERVVYPAATDTHTNRIPAKVILTEPGKETAKEFSGNQLTLDATAKTIKARNPGNPGVTLAWFGQPALTFSPYTINDSTTRFWPQPDPETVNPAKDAELYGDGWGNGYQTLNGPRRMSGRGVFAQWQATGSSVLIGALYANKPGEEPMRKLQDLSTDTVAGLRAETGKGTAVTVLIARQVPATLTAEGLTATGEALLVVTQPKQPANVIVLGAKTLEVAGKALALPSENLRFDLADAAVTGLVQIVRPLAPPTVGPAANTFTDKQLVTLRSDSPDAEIRYTTTLPESRLDEFQNAAAAVLAKRLTVGDAARKLALYEQPGADWQVYTGPFEITADTVVRARSFRKGSAAAIPAIRAAGTDVSTVSYGFFFKRPAKPAVAPPPARLEPGLAYDYLEGRWFALWTYADVLPAKSSGNVARLLDVSMRQTDQPFGVRYRGYLDIPADGVYCFYGPDEYINNTCEPGYDLRVYVDGEQWDLGQTWHGRGLWPVPLAKGLHRFMVTFADARAKDLEHQRVDLWRHYPWPQTTWRGIAPTLDVSGPGLERQPLPNAWLKH